MDLEQGDVLPVMVVSGSPVEMAAAIGGGVSSADSGLCSAPVALGSGVLLSAG